MSIYNDPPPHEPIDDEDDWLLGDPAPAPDASDLEEPDCESCQ